MLGLMRWRRLIRGLRLGSINEGNRMDGGWEKRYRGRIDIPS